MEDLKKVSSLQLYGLWRNLSTGLLIYILLVSCTRLLPFYMAPVLALGGALAVYTILFHHRSSTSPKCAVVLYAFFYCLIAYCIISISLNVLYAWGFIVVPNELIFFNDPYIVSLVLMPISFVTMLIVQLRRRHLRVCQDCRLNSGDTFERGSTGRVLERESRLQIANMTVLFGVISLIEWYYYIHTYVNVNQSDRDWYVFIWVALILFLVDELYFVFRYINLYLDLKESDEIISPTELRDMTAKTYLRFYVVCGDKLFVDSHSIDPAAPYREVIDTPFLTKRRVNGISLGEVRQIVENETGLKSGELKFFFGRRVGDFERHSILRYFFFVDTEENQACPRLKVKGEWMDFTTLKKIYSTDPGSMASIAVADVTRLATIILTEKVFDANGVRKNGIRNYRPDFTLADVRKSTLDFQDDKWIKVSMFNSDNTFFKLKKWWKNIKGQDLWSL